MASVKNMKPLELARRKLAFRIAEQLSREFPGIDTAGFDIDAAAVLVDQLIPSTYDESIEDDERFRDDSDEYTHRPKTASILGELRGLVHAEKGDSIVTVINGAVEMLREHESREQAEILLSRVYDELCCDDSFGVPGSEFTTCSVCNGGGSPYVKFEHDDGCYLKPVEEFLYRGC